MEKLIMSREEILHACENIGAKLTERLANEEKSPVFCCVMRGAMNFMVDLMEHVNRDLIVDYLQVSSYDGDSSTGVVILKKDIESDLEGRTLVIVEDIVDTGLSMKYLINHFTKHHKCKQVIVVALFDKRAGRKVDVDVDYAGMVLEDNAFLVGYGLDYHGFCRNVPYVYVPSKEEVTRWDVAYTNETHKKA